MATVAICALLAPSAAFADFTPGREVAVPRHLQDGEEFRVDIKSLNRHGALLFNAAWTPQEGGGRPLTKGTGGPLSDPTSPLLFPRNFNRISAPDANSCAGCHNLPRPGGGGDFVTNVFVLGQRFDHVTFDQADQTPLRGAVDELGRPVTLDSVSNNRATLGMNGSGYIERLAIEMTEELQAQRDR
ncbi:MAG: thiol oxidoreductase, partial [Planctomycetes bacterium]|nr:thiol oxidoreductase [Planctomycetota bacterium]